MLRFWPVIFVAGVLTLAGCGLWGGGDTPEREAAQKIRDAEALYDAKDYRRAVDLYERALQLQPSFADAHFKAAVIYDKKLDQFLPAIYHYDAFLKLEPNTERSKLAADFMNNAQFQYVATLPQFKTIANPDLAKLQAENDSLHRQISDMKTELVRLRSEKGRPAAPDSAQAPSAAPPALRKPSAPSPSTLSAAPPAPPVARAAKTYKVQRGDGMQTIAQKVYGDRTQWRRIMQANPQLKDPADLRPGQVLKIP